jgi:hypothetical protein
MISDGMISIAIRVVAKNFWASHAWQLKALCR